MTAPHQASPDFLASALAYARRGWRVLPVVAGDKRPALSRWPELATTDDKQVASWWLDQHDRNIGLATGRGSGFFVLDVDPKHGGDAALAELESEHGTLLPTYTVRTGSGGSHYYFLCPEFDVTNSPGALRGTGIDVRGEGGQVVAPPSVTALGAYEIINGVRPVDAPAWLLALIRPRPLALVGGTDVPRVSSDDFDRLLAYTERATIAAAQEVSSALGGTRNQTLNDQVLAIAGIAAHDPALVSKASLFETMHLACTENGYLTTDGIGRFAATFESAWAAGLLRPRTQWPPTTHAVTVGGPVDRPTVQVTGRKLNELVDEVLANLRTANEANPELFSHGTELVKVVGQPARTHVLDANTLAYEADVVMHFEKAMPKGGTAVANAPTKVIDTILSLSGAPLPTLGRISCTPFFSPSGRYVSAPGYDRESATFLAPAVGVTVPDVPTHPSADQVRAALSLVTDEVLADFPFVAPADRAHALALMLLPFVRDVIDGATPLHNIEAPTPGSGKGLLTKALLAPALGGRALTTGAPTNEEEWQKSLMSYLRLAPQALVIDNVNTRIASGFLCSALTEPLLTTRLLGGQEQLSVPVRTTWVMTANNPKFSDEVARRTIRIRIDPQMEKPEDRGRFRHADLLRWTLKNRGALIAACCTMVQGWVRAGMPEPVLTKPLGSFERWHAVMSGLLDFLDVPGLLENKSEFLSASDDESKAWGDLVSLMRRDLLKEWTSSELAEAVQDAGIAIDLGHRGNASLMLGRALTAQRDRWHDGYRFQRRVLSGKSMWRIVGRPDV